MGTVANIIPILQVFWTVIRKVYATWSRVKMLLSIGRTIWTWGVRVQSSGRISDVTADTAINKTMIRQAIVSCNFSEGILNGLSCRENVFAMAHNLRCMRCDYELFNRQLGILYDSAVKRVGRIKKKIKLQMLEFLEV